jgi:glycosyltransferase involved in cell wall biosynthesis
MNFQKMKKILFITQSMSRGGSEVALFHIITHIKNFQSVVYSSKEGVLLKKLPQNINYYVDPLQRPIDYYKNFFIKKLFHTTISEIYLENIIKKEKFDACLLNTITTTKWIPLLKKHNIPIGVFNHELYSIYESLTPQNFQYLINETNFIITPSMAVYNSIKNAGYRKKLFLFNEPININTICPKEIKTEWKDKFSFIFGMSGVFYTRKGAHLIVKIASHLKQKNAAIVWIGNIWDTGLTELLKSQLYHLNLNNVFFTSELDWNEYYSILNTIDAFLLTSIEDPYPIVNIEAAYLQKPIIAFDSGGVSEFVKPGMGKVVPLYNFDALFEAIDELITGRMYIDKTLLRNEAIKHDINNRIDEFEDILIEGFGWK